MISVDSPGMGSPMSGGPCFVSLSSCKGLVGLSAALGASSRPIDQQSTLASSSFDSTDSSDASYECSVNYTTVPEQIIRRRDHPDALSADAPPSMDNILDGNELRPSKRLHLAMGRQSVVSDEPSSPVIEILPDDGDHAYRSATASGSTCDLWIVQRNFRDDVVQKVRPPDLCGMSRRQREKALSEYRNELKVCQLVLMGFDEEPARQALKDTHQKDIRTEQHVQEAAHRLNKNRLVDLVERALKEQPK